MEPQTLVKRKSDGKLGVIVPDSFGCCDEGVAVVFDGNSYYQETMPDNLEVIGHENAIADFKKCGGGLGEQCCIFLTADATGFTCDRFSSLRASIIFKDDMVSKRYPVEMYPNCQLEEEEEEK